MSANIIDELMIVLGLDGSKAKAGMADVTKSIQSGMSDITKVFTGFGAALAAAFSVGSAFSTWREQADDIGDMAERLHMGIEELQGWTGALKKFKGTASDFESGIRGLNGQLARMAVVGKSRTGTILQGLGIDAGEIGRQRDSLAVLEDIAGVMEGMTDEEAQGIGQAIGLSPSMVMMLREGRDAMKDLIREKKEDALYTQADADAAEAYNKAMGKLQKSFISIAGIAFRAIVPTMTKITESISKFVKSLRKHQTFIKIFFTMIAGLITGLLIPTIWRFTKALLANPLTWVILTLAALALVIEDLIVWMNGGRSALRKYWEEWLGSPEEAKAKFEEYKTKFFEFVQYVKDKFGELKSFFASNPIWTMAAAGMTLFAGLFFTVIWPVISMIITGFKKVIDIVSKVPKAFTSAVTKIKNVFGLLRTAFGLIRFVITGLFKVIARLFMANPITAAIMAVITVLMDLYEWVTTGESMFDGLWTAIFGDPEHAKEIFNDVCQFLEDVWNAAIKFVKDKWEWLKSTAMSVCETIKGAIQSVADFIRSALGSAIDWAAQKWEALKSAISGGSVFVNHELTAAYASAAIGGGGVTNNSATNNYISIDSVYTPNAQKFSRDVGNIVGQSNSG
jgi:phage-related protein